MTVTLRKWGNSLAVRIPKSVVVDCRLFPGAAVQVSVRNGEVVLVPEPPRQTLNELLAGVTRRNLHREVETGAPVGREAW